MRERQKGSDDPRGEGVALVGVLGRNDEPEIILTGATYSQLSGNARDVVQARDISGGIHFHSHDAAPTSIPRQLPATVHDFIGRAANLEALDGLLPAESLDQAAVQRWPGTVVISAIDGTAGIGKTTLALHWAHRVGHRFPDGTLYTNLRGYGPGQPATAGEVLDGFLRALGVPHNRVPEEVEERAAVYRSILDKRQVLVVLDNASTPEQVRPLLPAGSGCLALVTSRSSMTGLVISHGATRFSLDLLAFDEAVALLRGIIGHARADAEPQALADIVSACARLPLALRIAGARAASRPHLRLADLRAELFDQHERIETLSATGDAFTAVRTVFDWSYQALPPAQALVFRLLGLHPGVEIDLHAAAALADISPQQVRVILEALAEVHLVELAAPGRYLAHDLLRAYALERVESKDSSDERTRALGRLLGFYLHTADAADRIVMVRRRLTPNGAPPPRHAPSLVSTSQAMGWFEAEYANLTAAASHAAAIGFHAVAWQLPAVLNGLFDAAGRRADWIAALENALTAARAICDRQGERYLLLCLSDVLGRFHRWGESIERAQQAVEIAREDLDRSGEADAVAEVGWAYYNAKQFDGAVNCFRQAGEIYRERDDIWGEAITESGLGIVYRELGELDAAISHQLRAIDSFHRTRDHHRESFSLKLLADAHQAARRLDRAIEYHEKSLKVASQIGNQWHQAQALDGLGLDLYYLGENSAARRNWQQALEIFERQGDLRADEIKAQLRAMLDEAD